VFTLRKVSASCALLKRTPQLTSAPTDLRAFGGATGRSSMPCACCQREAPVWAPRRLDSTSLLLLHTCAQTHKQIIAQKIVRTADRLMHLTLLCCLQTQSPQKHLLAAAHLYTQRQQTVGVREMVGRMLCKCCQREAPVCAPRRLDNTSLLLLHTCRHMQTRMVHTPVASTLVCAETCSGIVCLP
jgi:hypothetical protein